ncbi:UNVERIFIED_CONTAM: hypothetical protein Sangu_2766800 [Sesamum angustifolium]|uniref:MULE transposase domain-containing protein n=1 Tax=Sesamum angustifolium TaxID=2727405 RepID=A0AAW2IUC7_9LAMI
MLNPKCKQISRKRRGGVAVDDGNDHDLDEVEWDEVYKIVDRYAEGNGPEGNRSGDVDDDDGTNSNVDDCGGEDSGREEVESSDSEDTTSDDDVCLSQDDFDSVAGFDGRRKNLILFSILENKYDPHFEIGMIFSNKIELREAIHSHAWIMHALKLGEESTFQIRQYNLEHKCARSFNVKNVNRKWLSTKYEDAFRTYPKRNVKGFRKDAIKELRCHVSRNQAYRAKKKALEAIEGKAEDQFDSLWDYESELRNSNPGSTVMMVMTDGDDDCYMGGWVSSKGSYGGVLLTAVSIDPNNNLYPLAYAVVSRETREAWLWFL